MDPAFWHERWARDEIGFHREQVHPMLVAHWTSLAPATGEPVLVPLCGKSIDMGWLADRGHPVVGIELSATAARAFFEARGEAPQAGRYGGLDTLQAGPITLCIGDFFSFRSERPFRLVYDRAAMIALPPELRSAYRAALAGQLAADARGLLITLDYPQAEMNGPPFSVEEKELERDDHFHFDAIESVDALPGHPGFRARGLRALTERAWRFRPVQRSND